MDRVGKKEKYFVRYDEGGKNGDTNPTLPRNSNPTNEEIQYASVYYGVPLAKAKYFLAYPQFAPEGFEAPLTDRQKSMQEKGPMFASAADFFQYTPVVGDVVDLVNIPYVAATGEDIYTGAPQTTTSAAGWGLGGLLLPNIIEGPLTWGAKKIKGLLKTTRKVPDQALLDEFLASGDSLLPEEVLLNDIKNPNIKTGVSEAPINVKHGTQAGDITADDIKLFEDFPTRGHRPGPKGRKGLGRGGGFYTARDDRGSEFFGTDSRQHQIGLTIPEGSRYIDLSEVMKTDNLPIGDLQKLYQDGYDYIIGRNMLDAEEIIPLNPEILKSFKYNYLSGGKVKPIKRRKIRVLKK